MRTTTSDAGFSLIELMAATALGLLVIGTAMTTFKDAVGMTNVATNLADASQNLRGGMNLLVRDLTEAGRGIPIGGIPIPSGVAAGPINRPSPVGRAYTFDNINATTLTAITTGHDKGPAVDPLGHIPTDMITMLTVDPVLDSALNGALQVQPSNAAGSVPKLAADGSSFTLTANEATWITGDPPNGRPPVKKGDLLMFMDVNSNAAIQTVTRVQSSTVFFDSNSDDPFSFNQRNATAGSITQILGQTLSVQRVTMNTYYVDPGNGAPRLMRQYNNSTPQALAGVVEDLDLSYDLVDGSVNPTAVTDLPFNLNLVTYSANQIRKVNVHIGVRSETMSMRLHDYLRSHMSTVVSVRNLAYVDRYK